MSKFKHIELLKVNENVQICNILNHFFSQIASLLMEVIFTTEKVRQTALHLPYHNNYSKTLC